MRPKLSSVNLNVLSVASPFLRSYQTTFNCSAFGSSTRPTPFREPADWLMKAAPAFRSSENERRLFIRGKPPLARFVLHDDLSTAPACSCTRGHIRLDRYEPIAVKAIYQMDRAQ